MAEIVTWILRIASILCTCNGNNTWYLCDLQENKDALDTAMKELKDTRDDVKRKVVEAENNPNEPMACNKEVSGWLERVPAIEVKVIQVLLKAEKEIKGRCFGGYCSTNYWSRYEIGKLVMQTLAIVKDLKTQGGFKEVAYKLPPPSVQEEPTNTTVGMESMFDKVWRLLAEDKVKIMGLHGYGGVGKTTLLKQINNAFLKTTTTTTSSTNNNLHGYDVVILVVVSKALNIDAIQKEIGKRLGLSSSDRTSIFNALTKKNFVLLLDDIWERVDLQSIGIPPPSENNKSKIVLTTRSEVVCGLMEANEMLKVECLQWNEAWSLFEGKVGERALKSFPRARELAKVVARKCGGLPLALITIGRAMAARKTLQEWNDAITTLQKYASKFPGMDKEVLPLLKLSYDNLGDDMIKYCFLYCALFPEDQSIKKSKLIDYWIGEGFISLSEFNNLDDARNKGYGVIGDLKGASLLESGYNEETELKMHDTIRNLALWIVHECGNKRDKMFIIKTSDLTAERSSWYNNAERIYLIPPPDDGETKVRPPPPLKSHNLITLIHHFSYKTVSSDLSVVPQNFFEFTPLLRVLDLSRGNMETFPTSIIELVELRYLSLSWTNIQALPGELRKLVKLNHLDLSYTKYLRKIPSGVIGSLLELRVLNLYECYCYQVDWNIEEVGQLKHLNDLGITINTEHSTLTKLLSSSNKNLQMCTRHLLLRKHVKPQSTSTSTSTSSSSPIITLEKQQFLSNLKTLSLRLPEAYWLMNIRKTISLSPIITLEKLQLLLNLERLSLYSFPEADAQLMNKGCSCFQKLIQIVISSCNGLKDLTWVGYVPNLKILRVHDCKELEEIVVRVVVDDLGGSTAAGGGGNEIIFKSLVNLRLWGLPKLKSICRNALAFPCLESLEVYICPQLKKLPFDSGSNVNNTLRGIIGEEEWWNELRWEEEEDHDNNELLKSKFFPYFHKI